ncbi:hypothetical protein [Demequina litorisediminis]|nr:hypothetical protein [Demequina litorisediminis]
MMQIGFFRNDWGFGSAIAVIMFMLSFVVAVFYVLFVLRRDNSDAPRKAKRA